MARTFRVGDRVRAVSGPMYEYSDEADRIFLVKAIEASGFYGEGCVQVVPLSRSGPWAGGASEYARHFRLDMEWDE